MDAGARLVTDPYFGWLEMQGLPAPALDFLM